LLEPSSKSEAVLATTEQRVLSMHTLLAQSPRLRIILGKNINKNAQLNLVNTLTTATKVGKSRFVSEHSNLKSNLMNLVKNIKVESESSLNSGIRQPSQRNGNFPTQETSMYSSPFLAKKGTLDCITDETNLRSIATNSFGSRNYRPELDR